jgi:hypothetical protein
LEMLTGSSHDASSITSCRSDVSALEVATLACSAATARHTSMPVGRYRSALSEGGQT